MKKILHWKRGTFSRTGMILDNDNPIGKLKENTWTQSATGEINGKKYHFKTKGFLRQKTQITDQESKDFVGSINYNTWMTKAKIEFQNTVLHWKYTNTWQTQWSMFLDDKELIKYRGSATKGNIEYDETEDLYILTGLFVTNYFWQISLAVIIAVLIPVWLTVIR
jgi:hypothetical protein